MKNVSANRPVVAFLSTLALVGCGSVLPNASEDASKEKDGVQDIALESADLTLSFGDLQEAVSKGEKKAALSLVGAPNGTVSSDPNETVSSDPNGSVTSGEDGSTTSSVPGNGVPGAMPPAEAVDNGPVTAEELKEGIAAPENKVQAEGVQKIAITLSQEGQDDKEAVLDLSKERKVVIKALPTGEWKLAVKMLDGSGKVLIEGSGVAKVRPGVVNVAALSMEPDAKTGALAIVISVLPAKGDKDVDGNRPGAAPDLDHSRFLVHDAKSFYLDISGGQTSEACGPLNTSVQWEPGRVEINTRECARGGPVAQTYVIDQPHGVEMVRHFVSDIAQSVKLPAEYGPEEKRGCRSDMKPTHLFLKYENAKGVAVGRVYSAFPSCALANPGIGKLDGALPPGLVLKLRGELVRMAGMLGKRIYSQTIEPAPEIPVEIPPPGSDGDISLLEQKRDEARNLMKEAIRLDCRDNLQCVMIGYGHRACGGPEGFLVASRVASKMDEVFRQRDIEASLSREIAERSSAVGNCMAILPPQAYCNVSKKKCAFK